jgi:transcriptional regulator GlxA family with amidase domain
MTISDTFNYQHIDKLPGLTIGEATSAQFSFQPHFHLDYHIGLVTKGLLHQTWRGELAILSGLTHFQFIRRFQKQIGLAPHAWLMRLRLEKACFSLTSSNAMIADIATDNGFYDQSHFNRMFKMAYQIAPSQYRLHTA